MGLFDWFRSKPPAKARAPIALPAEYIALIETTRTPYAAVEIGPGDEPDPRANKLGGVPYRPAAGRHDDLLARGELLFIAQLRCADLPDLPSFPRAGLLQFWMARRDLLDGIGVRSDGRVCLYYPSSDAPQLEGWAPPVGEDESPLVEPSRGKPLTFKVGTECMPTGDYQWRSLLERSGLAAQHEELFELDLERYEAAGHRVAGYCSFTQDDPRKPDDPMVSLLQLDTTAEVEWGDSGIAHWFLREADLRELAFERTLFYWDCC